MARTRALVAWLRTLPPWPEPLPWDMLEVRSAFTLDALGPAKPDESSGALKSKEGHTQAALPALGRPLTLARARKVLREDFETLQQSCEFVVEQLNTALADQIPAKPNEPEALRVWENTYRTLDLARAAILEIHDALPPPDAAREITEADARALKAAFDAALGTLQKASRYVDRMDAEDGHGRTYAGLLKIGVCTALAVPIGLVLGAPTAAVGAGVYAMLYGKGAALDVLKAVRGGGGAS